MLTRRLISCLDVRDGRVVKGVQFEGLREVGSPAALAARYEEDGADELVLLAVESRMELESVRRTAERLFVPLCVGGGIRSVDDVAVALRAGADKVSINTAAVARPQLLTEAAERFGAQCVVASIDVRRWRVFVRGGREATALEVVQWAQRCVELGAGEILLTSIDQDGRRDGYDLPLVQAIAKAVTVPVIASGGAGSATHVVEAFQAGADAALVAGALHDGSVNIGNIKTAMRGAGVATR
jgi:cyclase